MNPTASSDKGTTRPPQSRAIRLKQIRQWHLYLGTFFAPSIIFDCTKAIKAKHIAADMGRKDGVCS